MKSQLIPFIECVQAYPGFLALLESYLYQYKCGACEHPVKQVFYVQIAKVNHMIGIIEFDLLRIKFG